MEPESNQVSNTSGTRRIIPLPAFAEASAGKHSHGTVISSTMCLCKSFTFFPLASSSSEALPNTFSFLHFSHFHIGITLAQKRWRETDQSRAPKSQSPKRPSLICAGDQLMFLAFLSKSSLSFVTETNHDDVA